MICSSSASYHTSCGFARTKLGLAAALVSVPFSCISSLMLLQRIERLQQCRLTTLETRRIRGDQIEVFKIMHVYEGLNKDMFFKIKNDSRTRGHSLALVKSHSRLDVRKYTFSQKGSK